VAAVRVGLGAYGWGYVMVLKGKGSQGLFSALRPPAGCCKKREGQRGSLQACNADDATCLELCDASLWLEVTSALGCGCSDVAAHMLSLEL